MEKESYKANLLAGFGSFKFLPAPFVVVGNNLNPKLILYATHIEYRSGILTNTLRYEDIEKIDLYFMGKSTNNLIISKVSGIWTFIGNFRKREQLQEFLRLFEEKGCHLTPKAIAEIEK